jgi:hypothetical protein
MIGSRCLGGEVKGSIAIRSWYLRACCLILEPKNVQRQSTIFCGCLERHPNPNEVRREGKPSYRKKPSMYEPFQVIYFQRAVRFIFYAKRFLASPENSFYRFAVHQPASNHVDAHAQGLHTTSVPQITSSQARSMQAHNFLPLSDGFREPALRPLLRAGSSESLDGTVTAAPGGREASRPERNAGPGPGQCQGPGRASGGRASGRASGGRASGGRASGGRAGAGIR